MNELSIHDRRALRDTQHLGWLLCGFLLALVIAFVLLSVLAPGVMGRPISAGNVLTVGFVLGIIDVLIVIGTAIYFEHRLNAADKRASKVLHE